MFFHSGRMLCSNFHNVWLAKNADLGRNQKRELKLGMRMGVTVLTDMAC